MEFPDVRSKSPTWNIIARNCMLLGGWLKDDDGARKAFPVNPFVPSVLNKVHLTKISILI